MSHQLEEAENYMKMGKYHDAISVLNSLFNISHRPGTLILRSICKMKIKDDAGAIEDLSSALQLDPSLTDAYYRRGLTYSVLGNSAKAIEDLSAAIACDPNCAQYYVDRADDELKLGKYDCALNDLEIAVDLDPNNRTFQDLLGDAYINANCLDKALELYLKLARKWPNEAEYHFALGRILFMLKKDQDAVEQLTEAIRLNPRFRFYYEARGNAYRQMGLEELAKEDENRAKSLPYPE